jgi:hypothetical protein
MNTLFNFISGDIERRTDLGTLETCGSVRWTLAEAGFDATSLRRASRRWYSNGGYRMGSASAASIGSALVSSVRDCGQAGDPAKASPESSFSRLTGH